MERDTLFGRIVVAVLALAVLATLVDSAVSRREPRPEPRVLNVTAEAYEEAEPDVVRISLGMKAVRPTPQQAAAQVTATVAAVQQRLARLGVTQDSIETSELYLGEDQEYDSRMGREVKLGYKAYHWLRVTLKRDNFPKLAQVTDAAVAGGATSLSGLTWEMEDDTPLRAAALEKATTRARTKAVAMANAAGTRLAGVYRISDRYSEGWEDDYGGQQAPYVHGGMAEMRGIPAPGAPAPPGMSPAEAPAGGTGGEPPASGPPPMAAPPMMSPPTSPPVPGKLRLNCSVQVAFLLR
jgi:uncharacterized protein YggE